MGSQERVDRAVRLESPGSGGLPVAPLVITYTARLAGMTQAEIFTDVGTWRRAVDVAADRTGPFDMGFALWPRDVPFSEGMKHKLPGRELGDDELFQVIEEEVMTPADYDLILREGWGRWSMDHFTTLVPGLRPDRLGRARVTYRFIRLALRIRGNAARLQKRGIVPAFYGASYPPFDYFSLLRTFAKFSEDLYDCPDLVKRTAEASLEPILRTMMQPLMVNRGKRVCIYPMRSSATFISPRMFEEFALGHLVRMTEFFRDKGITPILHCDANWTPMLPYLRELPRATCILELDEDTDIYEAKRILGDHMCLKGNVSPVLLAFGEAAEVEAECERLIREVGRDGGFILGSGCEVPLNAKAENLQAMLSVARGWGRKATAMATTA